MPYTVQAHLKPKALAGVSDDQIDQHWALYEGYVKNADGLIEAVAKAPAGAPAWAEMKRRLGFEIDGLVLHEYYFGNLAAGSTLSAGSDLATDLAAAWDPATATLFNWWVSSHEQGHPAGFHPVVVLDVFEHAYMVDHGASGRDPYIAAFLENVNWEVVEQRYKDSKAGRFTARF